MEVENRPGILAGIARVLAERGVNIWVINFSSRVALGEVSSGFIVADFTGREDVEDEVLEELKGLEGVRRAVLVEPQLPGILADTYHFPLVDDRGERHILVNPEGIRGIVVGLAEEFGDAAKAFLYHQGYRIGRSLAQSIREKGVEDLRQVLQYMLLYNAASGRYRGEITVYNYRDMPGDRIVVRMHDSWECDTARMHGLPGPASHLERGVLAGLLEELTGRKVVVREKKCVARGDPYCELEATFK